MRSFDELKNSLEKLLPSLWVLVRGIFLLVLWETPSDLITSFKHHWSNSESIIQKTSTIIAWLLIGSFIIYGFYGLYTDIYDWKTTEWREKALFKGYEDTVQEFFRKYNERFMAHDCEFMREVGADEAMYDKWGRTEYPAKNYSCEEFVRFQKQFIIPISIAPITKTWDKYRVQGEMIFVKINQGEPWKVKASYFEIWKKLDWHVWHFNNPKNGPRLINAEID